METKAPLDNTSTTVTSASSKSIVLPSWTTPQGRVELVERTQLTSNDGIIPTTLKIAYAYKSIIWLVQASLLFHA